MKLTAQALLTVRVNRDEMAEELSQVDSGAPTRFRPEDVDMLRHRLAQLDAIIRRHRDTD